MGELVDSDGMSADLAVGCGCCLQTGDVLEILLLEMAALPRPSILIEDLDRVAGASIVGRLVNCSGGWKWSATACTRGTMGT